MKMGRRDIQAVYCLNGQEHDAFSMYFGGSSVSQIGQALNMSTSQAGKVLDSARDHVWGGMTEKRVNRGEVTVNLSKDQYGSTKENNNT
jgi:hypothetical protein